MRTLLVDGNNLLARATFAAHASKGQMSVEEVDTGPVYLFINLLSKYVRLYRPTHMAVFWDAGHQMRDEVFAGYKSNRKKAEPGAEDAAPFAMAKEFLTWAGIAHKAHSGWEADDLIAATARQCTGGVAIVSGDKDMLQLLREEHGTQPGQGEVIQYKVPDEEPWTVERYENHYGWWPGKAAMVHALVGDTSDNVPGLPGVGPKKAVKALTEAGWDWETLLDQLGPEKAAVASQMRALVDLRDLDYPEWFMAAHRGCPEFRPTTVDDSLAGQKLVEFCHQYALKTVLDRLSGGTLWHGAEVVKPSNEGLYDDLAI